MIPDIKNYTSTTSFIVLRRKSVELPDGLNRLTCHKYMWRFECIFDSIVILLSVMGTKRMNSTVFISWRSTDVVFSSTSRGIS
jgi:hypothetical protein